jgi:hypothetical protein
VVYFSSPCALTHVTDVKLRAYEAGILPPLIQLLTTRERMVLQNSIATIRNLSFHPEVKAALMEAGAMFVPRLCRHVPRPFHWHSHAPCRPNVVSLLNSADPEVQEHAAATLRNIMSE